MGKVFNPPPKWSKPPEGWMPPPGWTPHPSWPPAPEGWQFYVDEADAPNASAGARRTPGDGRVGKRRGWEVVTNWLSALTAVAALTLSVVTYVQVNRGANVYLTMPRVLRISAPSDDGAQSIYVQPTFTADKTTDRPAVLLDMTLLVEPQDADGDMPLFPWHETVELTQSEGEDSTVRRTRVSDPVPILIYGSEPVAPMVWFLSASAPPALTVGELRATLLVEWQDRPSMVRDFCVDISQEAVDAFADPEGAPIHRFLKYPTSECYFFFV
jgi:hypothetical protein